MLDFLENLGIVCKDISLYEQALIHRSYINENPKSKLGHNERLEFLGDAVLELIVTDFLYKKYKDHNEGDLTTYRAALVNTNTIGNIANSLGFNDYLKLSKGESKDVNSKARLSILADAYEAMLGALYIDLGYEACRGFVERTLLPSTEAIVREGLFRDAKSSVQERAQERYQVTPSYKVLNEAGPDHSKIFEVGIYFGAKLIERGEGSSKQLAESDAARKALKKEGWV